MLALVPPRGSVAAAVASGALPRALVAAALHHLPASEMEDLDSGLEADVLVCSDHPEATAVTVALIEALDGLRPLDAGSLSQAAAIEAFTAVCITLNIRHRVHSTLRLWRDLSGPWGCGSTTRPGGRWFRSQPPPLVNDLHLRDHAVRLGPSRPRRGLPGLRRPPAPAPRPRPRDGVRAQRHRRRRRHPAQGPRARRALPGPGGRGDGPLRQPTWRRSGCCPCSASRGPPRPSRTSCRWSAPPCERGNAYQSGGAVYFDVSSFAGFGDAQPSGPLRDAGPGGRARGQPRRPEQAGPARLRALAAFAARRAVLGVALGTGSARLAHRVLGAGPARARGDRRHPRGWPRPRLPPPRVRDGPVRVGHRPAVRPPLDARRPGRAGRREDVQVARQPGLRERPAEGVASRRPSAWPCSAHHYRADWEWADDDLGGRRPPGRLAVAPARSRRRPAGTRALEAVRGVSTTTSTPPARSPCSTARRRPAGPAARGRAELGGARAPAVQRLPRRLRCDAFDDTTARRHRRDEEGPRWQAW